MSVSEHERIRKIEEQDLPELKVDLARAIDAIEGLRQESLGTGISFGVLPIASTLLNFPIFAALSVPSSYRKRKTYGSGNKQAAHEEFNKKDDLVSSPKKKLNWVEYTAQKDKTVTITITHSDGSSQVWKIKGDGVVLDPHPAYDTRKVIIAYGKDGKPTSIYFV